MVIVRCLAYYMQKKNYITILSPANNGLIGQSELVAAVVNGNNNGTMCIANQIRDVGSDLKFWNQALQCFLFSLF